MPRKNCNLEELGNISLVGALVFVLMYVVTAPASAQVVPTTVQDCREAVSTPSRINLSLPSVAVVPGKSGDRYSCRAILNFLSGCDEEGQNCLPNAAPAIWQRLQLHRGEAYTVPFFCGKAGMPSSTCADGMAPNGIDSGPRLVFYAGHGTPTSWTAQNEDVNLRNVHLGDQELRYFWQCSCNTMAHGQERNLGAGLDYYKPDTYFYSAGGADNPRKRNAFARWPAAVSPRLRLACGGASSVCSASGETANRIWDDFNNRGFDVADSFLEGVFNAPGGVPLCLTKGGESLEKTPLYDVAFEGDVNPADKLFLAASGKQYLYLSYPVAFGDSVLPVVGKQQPPTPGKYPVIRFAEPAGDVPPGFEADGNLLLSQTAIEGRGAETRIDKRSRATYVRGGVSDSAYPLGSGSRETWGDTEALYTSKALEFIEKKGWTETLASSPQSMRIVIERSQLGERGRDLQRFQKNVVVRIKRLIPIELASGQTELVPFIGAGGEIVVQLNNDGSVRNAAKVWRPIGSIPPVGDSKRLEARAPLEALEFLLSRVVPDKVPAANENAVPPGFVQIYDLRPENVPYVWGYKEESGNCRQKEMRLVYQFTFLPKPEYREKGYYPLTLEAPAQDGGSDPESQRTRFCEPEG